MLVAVCTLPACYKTVQVRQQRTIQVKTTLDSIINTTWSSARDCRIQAPTFGQARDVNLLSQQELSEIARKCGAVSDESYKKFRQGYDKLVDSLVALPHPTGGVKQMLHWKSDRIGSWLQGVRTLYAALKSEPDVFVPKLQSGIEVYGAGSVPKMDSAFLNIKTDADLLRVRTLGSRFFDDGFANGADFLAKAKDPKTLRCLTLDGGMSPEQIRDYVSRNSSGGARIVDLSKYPNLAYNATCSEQGNAGLNQKYQPSDPSKSIKTGLIKLSDGITIATLGYCFNAALPLQAMYAEVLSATGTKKVPYGVLRDSVVTDTVTKRVIDGKKTALAIGGIALVGLGTQINWGGKSSPPGKSGGPPRGPGGVPRGP
ncbi:MAG: hypothetical protein G01um101477_166 [Candidatus Doudnabacteria bacterium Gr01-1014_77]|uniref:Uncharacterized protein n=1 Tax=Candidatus Doudnabacteria bacterium Gr01-1014_77 TaxID=2017133 RepID=A0A554JD78_9BACT|nr:MAG: hypothetical protein G01um101477_166 [Candidatus Doudnabacteria bacterium Gr01-1014_77]